MSVFASHPDPDEDDVVVECPTPLAEVGAIFEVNKTMPYRRGAGPQRDLPVAYLQITDTKREYVVSDREWWLSYEGVYIEPGGTIILQQWIDHDALAEQIDRGEIARTDKSKPELRHENSKYYHND